MEFSGSAPGLCSGNLGAELPIPAHQLGMMRVDVVLVAPLSRHLQVLRLGGEGLRADGQRRALERVDFDCVVGPVRAFIQSGELRLLPGASK